MSRQVVTGCIVNPRVIGQHQVFESLTFLLILLLSSCPGSRGARDRINTLTVFNRSLKGLSIALNRSVKMIFQQSGGNSLTFISRKSRCRSDLQCAQKLYLFDSGGEEPILQLEGRDAERSL